MQIPCGICPEISKKIIYGKIKEDIGKMLRKLCKYKGVEIVEAKSCPDHNRAPGSKISNFIRPRAEKNRRKMPYF